MPISHLPANFTRTTGPAFAAIAFQWAVADLQPKGRKSDRQKNFCWKKIISLPPKAEVIILPTQSMHYLKGNPSNLPSICIVWCPTRWVIQWTLENPFFITYPVINMGREKFMSYRVQKMPSSSHEVYALLIPSFASWFLIVSSFFVLVSPFGFTEISNFPSPDRGPPKITTQDCWVGPGVRCIS